MPVDCSQVAGLEVPSRAFGARVNPQATHRPIDRIKITVRPSKYLSGSGIFREHHPFIPYLHKWHETNNMRMQIAMLAATLVAAFSLSAHASPPMAAGGMYTDAKGMTLYTFDKDPTSGPSACSGGCAQAWPAVMADASDKPQGDWATMPTADGGNQWTYKGKRVYTFSKDKKPGDANGDNFKDVWHTVKQ